MLSRIVAFKIHGVWDAYAILSRLVHILPESITVSFRIAEHRVLFPLATRPTTAHNSWCFIFKLMPLRIGSLLENKLLSILSLSCLIPPLPVTILSFFATTFGADQ